MEEPADKELRSDKALRSDKESQSDKALQSDKELQTVVDSQALERRASGRGHARKQANADSEPTVIAADSVRSLVTKLSQRYCKDGRPFAIASLDILEYEQVSNVLGAGAAEQLDRLGKVVCTNSLRGSDRVCFFEPGHILILLLIRTKHLPTSSWNELRNRLRRRNYNIKTNRFVQVVLFRSLPVISQRVALKFLHLILKH